MSTSRSRELAWAGQCHAHEVFYLQYLPYFEISGKLVAALAHEYSTSYSTVLCAYSGPGYSPSLAIVGNLFTHATSARVAAAQIFLRGSPCWTDPKLGVGREVKTEMKVKMFGLGSSHHGEAYDTRTPHTTHLISPHPFQPLALRSYRVEPACSRTARTRGCQSWSNSRGSLSARIHGGWLRGRICWSDLKGAI